jgi:hypothetical protein
MLHIESYLSARNRHVKVYKLNDLPQRRRGAEVFIHNEKNGPCHLDLRERLPDDAVMFVSMNA